MARCAIRPAARLFAVPANTPLWDAMWIISFLHILMVYGAISSVMQSTADLRHAYEIRHPQTCFELMDMRDAEDEVIECIWSHPGQYPPGKTKLRDGRCCFWEPLSDGVFWAIGQRMMSHVISVDAESYPGDPMPNVHPDSRMLKFEIYPAELVDIRVVDIETDAPVRDARVTMANDAMHLVSYAKWSDDDGYAVMPMIPGETYVMTVRAERYLGVLPFEMTLDVPKYRPKRVVSLQTVEELEAADSDTDDDSERSTEADELPVIERVVELDPGICVSGTVLDPDGSPLLDAEVHAEITSVDGKIYVSDIDHPVPMSALATFEDAWYPAYSNNSTGKRGQFELCTLPRGKVRLYATHPEFSPSDWVSIDARDSDITAPVTVSMNRGHRARLRVEDKAGRAISTTVKIYDLNTGVMVSEVVSPDSGSMTLDVLPEDVRFAVVLDEGNITNYPRTIADNDEIVLISDYSFNRYAFQVVATGSNGVQNIENASIHIMDANLQKSYPKCMADTDAAGNAVIESCPNEFWAVVTHRNYSNDYTFVTWDKTNYRVDLNGGYTYHIELRDGEKTVDAECTLILELKAGGENDYEWPETYRSKNGHLTLTNKGTNQYIECIHDGDSASAMLIPNTDAGIVSNDAVYRAPFDLVISFPQKISRDLVVLDAYGSPVPYARFRMDNKTYETDESGRYEQLRGFPEQNLEVFHYHHGRVSVAFEAGSGELEIHLPDKVDDAVTACLDKHKIPYITDSAAVQVDVSIESMQLMRGDYVESCDDRTLGIVRDDRRVELIMKNGAI